MTPPTKEEVWQVYNSRVFPPHITVQHLASVRIESEQPHTLLHRAAFAWILPPNTTATDLLEPPSDAGIVPLVYSIWHGYAPPNTTKEMLCSLKGKKGTAWDDLLRPTYEYAEKYVNFLDPQILKDDVDVALKIVEYCIEKSPKMKSKAIIWLGQILAAASAAQISKPVISGT